MADTPFKSDLTRIHWADNAADRDIHIEQYENQIDGSFQVDSIFLSSGLTNFKDLNGETNTYRGDRLGGVQVKSRQSGEALDAQRVVNDKYTITVDRVMYGRTAFDFQDLWVSPDRRAEVSREHGISHARVFDTAHCIQLIRAGSWQAPADLKASGSFNDGIRKVATGYSAKVTPGTIDLEGAAQILVDTHSKCITDLVNRDLGGGTEGFVTLVTPEAFDVLMHHKKLSNVDFQGGQPTNDFVRRRMTVINGIQVIETPRMPRAAVPSHPLGSAFTVTSDMAKTLMITYNPRYTLQTVRAKEMTVQYYPVPQDFNWLLDSYQMYTVDIRRGDATAVIAAD